MTGKSRVPILGINFGHLEKFLVNSNEERRYAHRDVALRLPAM